MAIQGICFTLGVELALASDIVVASQDAQFAQLEVARGILPFGGGTTRLPRVAGWGNAMRMLLTADTVTAADAYQMGIVTHLVETNPIEAATAFAARIAQQAPLAVQATLASARAGLVDAAQEHQRLPQRLGTLMMTHDVKRGMEAFLTKKPAVFEGD
jgi:enoyl-CoA hydratase/carnithine racemase